MGRRSPKQKQIPHYTAEVVAKIVYGYLVIAMQKNNASIGGVAE